MKKPLIYTMVCLGAAHMAVAEETANIGILLGFSGPVESLTPSMAMGAELALEEINTSGKFLDGVTLDSVRADSTCIDSSVATAAAERMVDSDGVVAIVGAACSGATTAVVKNVALPRGVTVISPASTSPALSQIDDGGYFFRTAPSDARQGVVLAEVLKERGVDEVSVTFTNTDYGQGFVDAFEAAYAGLGGRISISIPHEDGKGDYSAEVAALSAAGGEVLVVLGYADQGGLGIIQTALDTDAFETFALGDGMIAKSLINAVGNDLNGSFGTLPWSEGQGNEIYLQAAELAGFDGESVYSRESYDAAALIALAMFRSGTTDRKELAGNVMAVANAPGEPIYPGELAKALEILGSGGEIDYVGATDVELIGPGEASGTYSEHEINAATFKSIRLR